MAAELVKTAKKKKPGGAPGSIKMQSNKEEIMHAEINKVNTKELEEEMRPLLEAIAARVQVALERMKAMRLSEAEAALIQLKHTLPEPKPNNVVAAERAADRGIF